MNKISNNEKKKYSKNILLNWKQIVILVTILMMYHLILVLYSLGMFIGAYKTNNEIGVFIDLISNNSDGTILTILLLTAGIMCVCFSCFGVFLLLKSLQKVESKMISRCLQIHVFSTILLVLAILSLAVSVITHSYGLQENLEDGILRIMKVYSTDETKKTLVDRMQIKFQCCGSLSYKEWFDIEWYNPLVGGAVKPTANITVSDSIPFSCCLIGVLFPCVHHHLLTRFDIYTNPKDKQLSISTAGCHNAIRDETRFVGWIIFTALVAMSLLEIVGSFGMRIIQTAHSELNKFERDEMHLHTAWLITKKQNPQKRKAPQPPPIPSFLVDED